MEIGDTLDYQVWSLTRRTEVIHVTDLTFSSTAETAVGILLALAIIIVALA